MNQQGAGEPDITRLLADWSRGNRDALEALTPIVYRELHNLARYYLGRESQAHTLQPTALISEVYLKLTGQSKPMDWQNRAHFFGIAARLMRTILVDYARVRSAAKRGGSVNVITLEEAVAFANSQQAPDILAVDEALTQLAELDERKAQVIELRYFAGMTIEEIASSSSLSTTTVKRDLKFAEAWLRRHLMTRV